MSNTLAALSGVEVVDFGDFYASAVCAYHLHLLGATVKLAEPPEGCELRRLAQRHAGSGLFAHAGRGRHPITLDTLRDSVTADIVLEPAFPTPAAEAALAAHRARDSAGNTIALSFREMDGTQLTELTAQAELGMSAFLGRQGDPPLRVGMEMVGTSAGTLATQAILAALRARAASGQCQQIRVPLSRVLACILNNVVTASIFPDQPCLFSQVWSAPPALGFTAADGAAEIRFYGPRGERGFPAFCRGLGAHALAEDPRFNSYRQRLDHHAELVEALAPWSGPVSRDALLTLARDLGAYAMPKHDVAGAREWEQTLANAMVDGPEGARLATAPWQVNGIRPTATERIR